MGLGRKALNTRDRMDALETNARNRIVKDKERARRDARMMAKIKAGSLPYTHGGYELAQPEAGQEGREDYAGRHTSLAGLARSEIGSVRG